MADYLKRLFIIFSSIFITYGATATELPTASDFTVNGSQSSFSLSPNGQFLALLQHDKKLGVYIEIRDLESGQVIKKMQTPGRHYWQVTWYDNKRLLISASSPAKLHRRVRAQYERQLIKKGMNTDIYNPARLFLINADGSNFRYLFKTESRLFAKFQSLTLGSIVDLMKHDPEHLLLEVRQIREISLWKINVDNGNIERIEEGEKTTSSWVTNLKGTPIFRLDQHEKGRVYSISSRAAGQKKWAEIIRLRKEDLENFRPVMATNDPDIFIVSARTNSNDRTAFYKYNIVEKQFLEAIYSHEKVDVNSLIADTANKPIGFSFIDDIRDYKFTDPDFSKRYADLKSKLDPQQNITLLEVNKDRRFWLIHTSSPTNPGKYYYFDSEKSVLTTYATDSANVSKSQLSRMEIINYITSDQIKITGYLAHPVNSSSKTPPLIVFPHGGPEARDRYDYDLFTQFFASRGYMVFQPNFRGSSGYGRKFAESGYGQWGRLMQDDITDGINYLSKTGKIDIANMCIAGISYGGYAALTGAVKTPNMYKCAISINGVSDLMGTLKYDKSYYGSKSIAYKYVVKTIGDPKTDKLVIQANSPIEHIDKFNIPILLIHGANDQIVPIRQSQNLYKKLKENGADVEYLELEFAGHNLNYKNSMEMTLNKVETFLKRVLPIE